MDLLHAFSSVLIMDCTYKINRYRMPLLEIVGLTCTDLTFFMAFMYLHHENDDNFVWTLGVLRSVMDDSALPKVIVTDKELALMNVISRVFLNVTHFLCR